MKQPKEPKIWKHPRLYWQPINDTRCSGRLRIIKPDGTCCYSPSEPLAVSRPQVSWFYPCWMWPANYQTSPGDLLEKMRAYDERRGYPVALFLGEIK